MKGLTKDQYLKIHDMCKHSNSLYNSGMYIIKNYFDETNKYMGYNGLYKEIKDNVHYKSIPAKIAQQTLRLLDKDFRSFFALLKRKKSGQYQSDVHIPRYKKSKSEFILILPNDQVTLNNSVLKITKDVKLKFTHKIDGKIKQLVIKPNGFKSYTMLIQYEQTKNKHKENVNTKNFLSIDLGINNLATCISNVGPAFIVSGKPVKARNQFYNKRKAEVQESLERCNKTKWSKQLSKMSWNRTNFINSYFDQSIAYIMKYCKEHNIGTVVVGYNEGWKQEINIGKVNNQKFCSIPHNRFKMKLEYKCEDNSIDFIQHEESYTSKCSFVDAEPLKKQESYLGRRKKRGLFVSSKGVKINSDVNGACNIARKVFPEFCYEGVEAFIVSPKVFNTVKPFK